MSAQFLAARRPGRLAGQSAALRLGHDAFRRLSHALPLDSRDRAGEHGCRAAAAAAATLDTLLHVDGMVALGWMINHPWATLTASLATLWIVPTVVKALWRALVIPAFLLTLLAVGLEHPDLVVDTAQTTAMAIISFVQHHPQMTSIGILLVLAVLLTSSVVPFIAAILTFFAVFAPGRIHLPSLPEMGKKWQRDMVTRAYHRLPFVSPAVMQLEVSQLKEFKMKDAPSLNDCSANHPIN